ncbi:metallophosphoesterase [Candidatus Bipolaricaulota bacterium]|nr:metallophosphoesterase [Candidatus Bipolaricaulota bacterium]
MKPEKVRKLGIIADSHDNMDLLGEAVDLFEREKVDLVLHAGDFMSPLTADPLSDLQADLVGVFGNNDGDKLFLRRRFEEEGVGRIEPGPHRLELGERTVLLMHEPRLLEVVESSSVPDLIVYGHTHEVVVREDQPLVVNPGEVGGWLTGRSTVGLVDLKEMEVEIKDITG